MGSHLHILVLLDIFKSLLERKYHRGNDTGLVIGTARTHIGEFLRLSDVDNDVVILGVLAYNLSGIDLLLREDEEAAAILELVDGIGIGCTGFHGNERTVGATLDVALPGLIFMESVSHDGLAGRRCEHVVTQTDDAARRYQKLEVYAVILSGHGHHLTLAACHHVDNL